MRIESVWIYSLGSPSSVSAKVVCEDFNTCQKQLACDVKKNYQEVTMAQYIVQYIRRFFSVHQSVYAAYVVLYIQIAICHDGNDDCEGDRSNCKLITLP